MKSLKTDMGKSSIHTEIIKLEVPLTVLFFHDTEWPPKTIDISSGSGSGYCPHLSQKGLDLSDVAAEESEDSTYFRNESNELESEQSLNDWSKYDKFLMKHSSTLFMVESENSEIDGNSFGRKSTDARYSPTKLTHKCDNANKQKFDSDPNSSDTAMDGRENCSFSNNLYTKTQWINKVQRQSRSGPFPERETKYFDISDKSKTGRKNRRNLKKSKLKHTEKEYPDAAQLLDLAVDLELNEEETGNIVSVSRPGMPSNDTNRLNDSSTLIESGLDIVVELMLQDVLKLLQQDCNTAEHFEYKINERNKIQNQTEEDKNTKLHTFSGLRRGVNYIYPPCAIQHPSFDKISKGNLHNRTNRNKSHSLPEPLINFHTAHYEVEGNVSLSNFEKSCSTLFEQRLSDEAGRKCFKVRDTTESVGQVPNYRVGKSNVSSAMRQVIELTQRLHLSPSKHLRNRTMMSKQCKTDSHSHVPSMIQGSRVAEDHSSEEMSTEDINKQDSGPYDHSMTRFARSPVYSRPELFTNTVGGCSSGAHINGLSHRRILERVDSSDSGVEAESSREITRIISDLTNELNVISDTSEEIASRLLSLNRDIQHYKFQCHYQRHRDVMDAAIEDEDELKAERSLFVDVVPERLCSNLSQWGLTKNHLRQRRFSIF